MTMTDEIANDIALPLNELTQLMKEAQENAEMGMEVDLKLLHEKTLAFSEAVTRQPTKEQQNLQPTLRGLHKDLEELSETIKIFAM